ncbi:hypothetical protein PMAYCL1PPCAC_14803, partial [Pristionchus mayeri]
SSIYDGICWLGGETRSGSEPAAHAAFDRHLRASRIRAELRSRLRQCPLLRSHSVPSSGSGSIRSVQIRLLGRQLRQHPLSGRYRSHHVHYRRPAGYCRGLRPATRLHHRISLSAGHVHQRGRLAVHLDHPGQDTAVCRLPILSPS